MSAQDTFVHNVNGRNWVAAADQLHGSAMYDILTLLVALGPNGTISVNNLSGVLRNRGWFGAAQRIEWAGEVVRTRRIPNPPPGLPADQVADGRKFLEKARTKDVSQSHSFDIVLSFPFRLERWPWRSEYGRAQVI